MIKDEDEKSPTFLFPFFRFVDLIVFAVRFFSLLFASLGEMERYVGALTMVDQICSGASIPKIYFRNQYCQAACCGTQCTGLSGDYFDLKGSGKISSESGTQY